MKLVAIMPVRNEAWCLGLSARVALSWCDELICFMHGCSADDSGSIIDEVMDEYDGRVHVWVEHYPEWNEMAHRQKLLEVARERSATHISIVDADEILTGNMLPGAAGFATTMPRGHILQLPGYNLRGGIDRYHSSGIWGKRWFSVAFADDPRLHWGGDKFHAREPAGMPFREYRPISQGQGGILHLWGASERRLKAKHALYKITERLRWPDKPVHDIDNLYSMAIYGRPNVPGDNPQSWKFAEVPAAWWEPYAKWMQYLDIDAEPWQESECKRQVAHHGAAMFHGLDLFGVA